MRSFRQRIAAAALFVLLTGMAVVASAVGEYHGNARSRIYHNSSCRYYDCRNCTVVFSSAKAARAAGFRACKACGG